MSTPVSHKSYEIVPWPETSVYPQILYLQVGEQVTAAAAATIGGWRMFLYESDVSMIAGTNVGDLDSALGWLDALGQAATA